MSIGDKYYKYNKVRERGCVKQESFVKFTQWRHHDDVLESFLKKKVALPSLTHTYTQNTCTPFWHSCRGKKVYF